MLNHWWRQLVRRFGYRLKAPHRSQSLARPRGYRPRLETLEDRTLMTAGILDSAFGNGGLVTTDLLGNGDRAGGVAVQADGKIVVVGQTVNPLNGDSDIVVVRYNSNGTLDTSFGFGGRVTTNLGANEEATAVVIQADGKIVVGGYTNVNGNYDFVLVRYDSNGYLDTASFGFNGIGFNGFVTTDFGGGSYDAITALVIQQNQFIVAVGVTDMEGTLDFAVARYNPAGELDTNFGIDNDGKTTIDFFGDQDLAYAVGIDGAGNIVVVGTAVNDGTGNDFAIARLLNNGTLDPDFGLVTTDFNGGDDQANAIGFLSNGKIVVGGFAHMGATGEDFALAVYLSDGTLDGGFGTGGKVTTDIRDTGGNDIISALVVNTIGTQEGIVVVGSAFAGSSSTDSQFVVARYTLTGALDFTFGAVPAAMSEIVTVDKPGIVRTTFGVDSALGTAVTVDARGRIVAAGYADLGEGRGDDFAVARFVVADPFSLTSINEDPGANPPNTLLSEIVQGEFTAVAIIGLNNTANGTWQYSLNGTAFINFGDVSEANARLLIANATTRIRFLPNANFHGEVSLTLVAWNHLLAVGTAGGVFNTTLAPAAFGNDALAATLTVIPVNDAPVISATPANLILDGTLANGTVVPGGVTSAGGVTVGSFAGTVITDVDGDPPGIAITAAARPNNSGVWEFSIDDGVTWTPFGPGTGTTVAANNALLLREDDLIRFVPNVGFTGNATITITFRAWDNSVGIAGTRMNPTPRGGSGAFSTATKVANVPLRRNIAPVLVAGTPTLPPVTVGDNDPDGTTVGELLGIPDVVPPGSPVTGSVTDSPSDDRGIAIIAAARPNNSGVWQYALQEAPGTWIDFGPGTAIPVSAANALHLREGDLVRFLPNPAFTATTTAAAARPTITYRAWDQTNATPVAPGSRAAIGATGGVRPYSTGTQRASVLVNTAPTLAAGPAVTVIDGKNVFGQRDEDTTFISASLLNGNVITIIDPGTTNPQNQTGLAIIGVTGNGTWQFSNAATGTAFTAVGNVSETSARLMAAIGRLRFIPAKNFSGEATITVVAWDRTVGALNGFINLTTLNANGQTAFSALNAAGGLTLTLIIDAVNDAPVLSGSKALTKIPPGSDGGNGDLVSSFASPFISDPDGNFKGVAIIGATGTAQGQWRFSLDGGSNWINFPATVSATNVVLLPPTARVQFVPANANVTGTFTLTFRAWDGTQGESGIFDNTGNLLTIGGAGSLSAGATRTTSLRVAP